MLVNCPIVPRGATTAGGHEVRLGWYRGEQVEYFDLGVSSVQLGDVYEFVVSPSPAGGFGYSDAPSESVEVEPLFIAPATADAATHFFRLHRVEAPDAATARSIATTQDIEARGLTVVSTGQVTNRPVVGN
jgi:hypothetical protein